jgi:hypothetical protein
MSGVPQNIEFAVFDIFMLIIKKLGLLMKNLINILSVKNWKKVQGRKNELAGRSLAMPDLDILVMMRLPQRPCMEFMCKSKIVFIFNQIIFF